MKSSCFIFLLLVASCSLTRHVTGRGKHYAKTEYFIQTMCRNVFPRFYRNPGARRENSTPVHHAITTWETQDKLKITIRGNDSRKIRACVIQVRYDRLPRPRFLDYSAYIIYDCKPFKKNMIYVAPLKETTEITVFWILPREIPANKLWLYFSPVLDLPTYWVLHQPIAPPPLYRRPNDRYLLNY